MRNLGAVGALLLFVAGTLTVCNVLRTTDVLRLEFVRHAADDAADATSSFSPNTKMITSLEQRIHQLTEEFTRVKQQQQQLQKKLETHTMQTHDEEPQKHQPPKHSHQQQQDRIDRLPQCDEVMQAPNSPFQDGAFITAHTTPIQWTPRADGSRQFDLNNYICHLKRYTAKEAKQCLASSYQHMSFIGDSLSRYQYLSLTYFLEHDAFPPRFGSYRQPCTHVNESGHETCSRRDQPNICMETDWSNVPKEFGTREGWVYFFASLGGYSSPSGRGGGIMNGHMECNCARAATGHVENELYINTNNKDGQKFVLTYFREDGWGNNPNPLHGFYFTNCSETGTCHTTV
jgi:hypothetical protein